MAINYSRLFDLMNTKGLSANALYLKGIITEHTAQQLRKNNPISLKHIDSICQFLRVPIEQVVEITLDDPSEED